jgi:hypothetical protein
LTLFPLDTVNIVNFAAQGDTFGAKSVTLPQERVTSVDPVTLRGASSYSRPHRRAPGKGRNHQQRQGITVRRADGPRIRRIGITVLSARVLTSKLATDLGE